MDQSHSASRVRAGAGLGLRISFRCRDLVVPSKTGQVSSLSSKDRVATAGWCMRGGERKLMQPMAQRLGVDHQRLQQFVRSSPWTLGRARMALSRRVY